MAITIGVDLAGKQAARQKKGPATCRPLEIAGKSNWLVADDDPSTDLDPLVEVHDIFIGQTNAARGYGLSDGPGLCRAVQTVHGGTDVKSARAKRIFRSTFHITG